VYPGTPPETVTLAVPSGLQEAGVEEVVALIAEGSLTLTLVLFEHPLASLTITE
jgi:hypothetical protein